jgi:hypothetical protein
MIKRKIHLDKFPDKPHVLKTSLMFVEDNKICDGCDEISKCASIRTLGGNRWDSKGGVSILCQDCIEGILDSLDSTAVRDIKIDKILK